MKIFIKLLVPLAFSLAVAADAKDIKLLNVSYDPTRELYQEYNVLPSPNTGRPRPATL